MTSSGTLPLLPHGRGQASFLAFLLSAACAVSALAQTADSQHTAEMIGTGIVIEKFDDDFSGAKKAGMQEGDVLLSWSRGEAVGNPQSPFDLSLVVTEQMPYVPIKFEGLRGTDGVTWTLVKQYWGATLRPNFSGALLTTYLEGVKLAQAGKPDQAAERWRAAAVQVQGSEFPWLASWFLFRPTCWTRRIGGKRPTIVMKRQSCNRPTPERLFAVNFYIRGE